MGSSRLPGKVLADIGGHAALDLMIQRIRLSDQIDDIVVATSTAPQDDAIAAWARDAGVHVHRGSEDDVLQRVSDAHAAMRSDVIVELTGDCPLIDPGIIDLAVETFLANRCDVVSSAHSGTYPSGTDVQVFRASDLAEIAATVTDPAVREHVSLHFYESPERYAVIYLVAPRGSRMPGTRLDLDYPEDLVFIRAILAELEPRFGLDFGTADIAELLVREPRLAEINAHCVNKAAR